MVTNIPGVERTVETPFGVAGGVGGITLVTTLGGEIVCVLTGTAATTCVDAFGMIVLDNKVVGATTTRTMAAPGIVDVGVGKVVCPGCWVTVIVTVVPAVGETVDATGDGGACTMIVWPFGATAPGVKVVVEDTTTATTPVGALCVTVTVVAFAEPLTVTVETTTLADVCGGSVIV